MGKGSEDLVQEEEMEMPERETEDGSTNWTFAKLTTIEVYKIVKSINVCKSSGLTNISSFVLKEVFLILIEQVTYMFKLAISSPIFPSDWKKALVIPIPKTRNLTKVQNYRPIFLLPLPGKLLEKLVHSQLSEYL